MRIWNYNSSWSEYSDIERLRKSRDLFDGCDLYLLLENGVPPVHAVFRDSYPHPGGDGRQTIQNVFICPDGGIHGDDVIGFKRTENFSAMYNPSTMHQFAEWCQWHEHNIFMSRLATLVGNLPQYGSGSKVCIETHPNYGNIGDGKAVYKGRKSFLIYIFHAKGTEVPTKTTKDTRLSATGDRHISQSLNDFYSTYKLKYNVLSLEILHHLTQSHLSSLINKTPESGNNKVHRSDQSSERSDSPGRTHVQERRSEDAARSGHSRDSQDNLSPEERAEGCKGSLPPRYRGDHRFTEQAEISRGWLTGTARTAD